MRPPGFDYGGSYFGQVYVAAAASTPTISVRPSTLFEGENTSITASITSPGGKEVTNGSTPPWSIPDAADDIRCSTTRLQAFALVPLAYDVKLNAWSLTPPCLRPTTLPSRPPPTGTRSTTGGPYDVYVSGVSADGVPTNACLTAQQSFYVQPYVYTADTVNSGPTADLAPPLSTPRSTPVSSPVVFSGDDFVGNNTVTGSDVTITSSTINGTLNVRDGQTTLDGVTGGNVVAQRQEHGATAQHPGVARPRVGRHGLYRLGLDRPESHARASRGDDLFAARELKLHGDGRCPGRRRRGAASKR